jgi:hypothetical protein
MYMVSYYAKPIFTLNAQSYKHETLTSIKHIIKYALNANIAKFLILFCKNHQIFVLENFQ